MATGLLEGAVVGAAVQEGVKPVKGLISKAKKFKSTRRRLANIVERVMPFVKGMKPLDGKLDRPKEESEETERQVEQLQQGQELVNKRSKVPCWKCCCLPCYQGELQEMVEQVETSFLVTHARAARDGAETLLIVRGIEGRKFNGLCKPPEISEPIVGLDGPLITLKKQLLESGTSVLVLTGLAGSGKSTLATLLCHHEHVKGKFEKNIMFVTVSKTPNLKIIVQTLFEHWGWHVPDFLSDEQAVTQLKHLLKKIGESPMMLVLDDVWQGFGVEAFQVQLPDYKILVTSRVEFPRFGTACQLGPLSTNDAVTLFSHFANRSDNPGKDLVQQVRSEGLLGFSTRPKIDCRSLNGQPIDMWLKMEQLLSKGRSIVVYNTDLRDCLQKCLDDALEDRPITKECFMDLGLFPEDQKIPVAALIDMWTELYELEDRDIDGMNIVHELTQRLLVNLVVTSWEVTSDADNYYNNHFLTQHDLLREIAIHQARQEQNEQRKRLIFDINENDWPLQNLQQAMARTLSLSIDEMDTPDWCNMLSVEELEVLILNLRTKKYSLPQFMEKMSKLKVLLVTNYDGFHFSELNNSELLGSLSSLKKIRLQQISVPFLGELINLRKLSLYMCNTSQAFQSDNIPVSLPNLEELSIDYSKDLVELPAGLSGITSLKKLSITRCSRFSVLSQEIGKLVNLEVLRLSSCSMLAEIPTSIGRLRHLGYLDISYCLGLGNLPDEIGDLGDLRVLHMTGCSKCKLSWSITSLKHLSTLICDQETAVSWEIYKPSLPNLEIKVTDTEAHLGWLL